MDPSLANLTPVRRQELWLRETNGESVLFDPQSGRLHVLNETAVAVWQLCDGETRPHEMVDAISGLFHMDRDVVWEDVSRILEDFKKAGLLRWSV